METSSALLHPVRLRIVQALLASDELTTQQLHEKLSDVPIATLYRHVGYLAKLGLVEVATERQVRGTSEKAYRVAGELANPSPEELRSLSSEELLTVFTVFISGLIRDFDAYLGTGTPDLAADQVSFAQADFWATDSEVEEFGQAMMAALRNVLDNQPREGRRRRALTTVLIPRPKGEESA
ncbi:DNA-binding transcriptional ArsR family regulator [Rhodococcus sp. LBL1]|nr:DNA-binding transcriptional ArsR family regulator [Rhodococcus sp. LBL1]MDH6685510.1 DNA-binding transcriptional ArsR family regulator [Rhodococcus sp. LBL2]